MESENKLRLLENDLRTAINPIITNFQKENKVHIRSIGLDLIDFSTYGGLYYSELGDIHCEITLHQ